MQRFAIALGVCAWTIPAIAQLAMWLRLTPGSPSMGLFWLVMTLGALLPACASSIVGAWLWHRAARAADMRVRARRIGLVLIATPAFCVALLGVHVVADIVIERLKLPAAA